MSVVGTLTVDLVANTASFSGDLGKAAQSAQGFGKAATEAGEAADYSMREARGSLMLMGDEFGVHLPREIRTMIAEVPGIGVALESLLPIMGAVFAVKLITEWIEAHKRAQEELAEGWAAVGETFDSTMASIGDQLLAVKLRTDELSGDSIAALKDRLELIDHQTMQHIIEEFKKAETEVDKLLAKMDSNRFMKMLGEVDTGPAQEALQKVGTALEKIRNTTNDPKEAIAVLSQGIVDATSKFDALADAQRKAAGVIKDSPQDKFLAAHLTDEAKAWDHVVDVLKQQMEEAQARVTAATGEKNNAGLVQEKADVEALTKTYNEQQEAVLRQGRAQVADHQRTMAAIAAETAAREQAADELAKMSEGVPGQAEQLKEAAKAQQDFYDQAVKGAEQSAQARLKLTEETNKQLLQAGRQTAAQAANADVEAVQREVTQEKTALQQRLDALDHFANDYKKKEQELQNQIAQIEQQGQLKILQIQGQSLAKEETQISQAENKMGQAIASAAAKSILESKNMGQAFEKVAAQMLQSAVTNFLELETIQGRKKLSDAKTAAADAYAWAGNPILGAVLAAGAFTAVMAFERGGEIPGSGPVPIMGHGGETVVTKALTDQVKNNTGGGGRGHTLNYSPEIHAVDSDGVERMLKEHSAIFMKEFKSAIRKQHVKG